MSKIKVKLLTEECRPTKTHRWDAGWDLKASEATTIPAGGYKKVKTGVIFEIPPRYFGMVAVRSSIGAKHGLRLRNSVGIVDSEYRGEVFVFIHNTSDEDYTIEQYDRFAQIVITPVNTDALWVVDKVSNTGRGTGGFGSTGKDDQQKKADEIANEVVQQVEQAHQDAKNSDLVFKEPSSRELAEKARIVQIENLKKLSQAEYMKLKNSGMLFEKYPIATGNIKEDLGLE